MSKPWVGVSDAHRSLLELIERVAKTEVELLFFGETGVGKEHYARYAHTCSPRATGPFVPVNCGSIPSELFENELFGHIGGAFTGARARATGLVAAA
jgi:DNA-binding NtrC family response regulator